MHPSQFTLDDAEKLVKQSKTGSQVNEASFLMTEILRLAVINVEDTLNISASFAEGLSDVQLMSSDLCS